MKNLVIMVLIVAAGYFFIQKFKKGDVATFERHARARVQAVCGGLLSDDANAEQDAVAFYRFGKPTSIDADDESSFHDFLKAGGLQRKATSCTVGAIEIVDPDSQSRKAMVEVSIGGKKMTMVVRDRQEIDWN